MKAIDLAGFSEKFAGDSDPWSTFSDHDEAVKRDAILHALGPGPIGRVLELASGNGSNSAAIAPRALRLDATEGTPEGTKLTAGAIERWPRARACLLALPGRPPRIQYDAVVIAELLYYLTPVEMAATARMSAHVLQPGGPLVLAHHRINFHDFVQHAEHIHGRFLRDTGVTWRTRIVARNDRWVVVVAKRKPTGR